jgi:pseudoazurin
MKKFIAGLMVAMIGFAAPALAEELPSEYTVEMWNIDPEDRSRRMVFSEEVVQVAPGATVEWLATDRSHNVEFISGPDGVDLPKRSKMNEDFAHTFSEPGVYVYVCTPHATMGMIGIVVVGEATAEQIEAAADAKVRGQSKKKLAELIDSL